LDAQQCSGLIKPDTNLGGKKSSGKDGIYTLTQLLCRRIFLSPNRPENL